MPVPDAGPGRGAAEPARETGRRPEPAPRNTLLEPIIVKLDPAIRELVPKFISISQERTEALRRHLGGGALDQVAELAHTLKGGGGAYGFDEVSRLAGELERAARAGNVKQSERLTESLAQYLCRIQPVYD